MDLLENLLLYLIAGLIAWANPSKTVAGIECSANTFYDSDPQLNNSGDVVWTGGYLDDDGLRGEIFLYDGSSTVRLSDNPYQDVQPYLNDKGDVVWWERDDSDYELFL